MKNREEGDLLLRQFSTLQRLRIPQIEVTFDVAKRHRS